LIEKPKTLRWRSAAAMLRAFAERVDLNRGPAARVTSSHLNQLPAGVARRTDILVKLEG